MKSSTKYFVINFVLVVSLLLIILPTFAAYSSTYGSSSTAQVAKLNLSLNNPIDTCLVPMSVNSPEDTQDYYFDVVNYDEDGNNLEVTMNYKVKINTGENLPLLFKLYKYNYDTNDYDIEVGIPDNETNDTVYSYDELGVHKYKLNITWDENETDAKYSKSIDYVQVLLDASQVN